MIQNPEPIYLFSCTSRTSSSTSIISNTPWQHDSHDTIYDSRVNSQIPQKKRYNHIAMQRFNRHLHFAQGDDSDQGSQKRRSTRATNCAAGQTPHFFLGRPMSVVSVILALHAGCSRHQIIRARTTWTEFSCCYLIHVPLFHCDSMVIACDSLYFWYWILYTWHAVWGTDSSKSSLFP